MIMVSGKAKPSSAAAIDPNLKADLLGSATPIAPVGIDQPRIDGMVALAMAIGVAPLKAERVIDVQALIG